MNETSDIIPNNPQIPKLLVQGKLLKKEEFDEDGHSIKSDWEHFHVVLERSQLTFEKVEEIISRKPNIKKRLMSPLNKSVSDITVMKEKPPKARRESGTQQSAEILNESPGVQPNTPEEPEFRLSIAISKQKKQQHTSLLFRRLKSLDSTSLEAEIQQLPPKLSYLHAKSTDNLFIPEEAAQNITIIDDPISNKTETIVLNNLCRVQVVSSKKDTFRVMLGTQRSFLLRASNPNELELWLQSMQVSISMVNFTYSSMPNKVV